MKAAQAEPGLSHHTHLSTGTGWRGMSSGRRHYRITRDLTMAKRNVCRIYRMTVTAENVSNDVDGELPSGVLLLPGSKISQSLLQICCGTRVTDGKRPAAAGGVDLTGSGKTQLTIGSTSTHMRWAGVGDEWVGSRGTMLAHRSSPGIVLFEHRGLSSQADVHLTTQVTRPALP
jgi:hypothetical protein